MRARIRRGALLAPCVSRLVVDAVVGVMPDGLVSATAITP